MSIRFEVSESIRTPPERILDTLLDLESADRWMPGLVRMEQLTPGPLVEGSEWRETRKMFGKEATEQFTLTALDAPRRLELFVDGSQGSSRSGEYRFAYLLEPSDGETTVRLTGEIGGVAGIMGWIARLFVGTLRKGCAKDLRALKAYLEGDSVGPAGSVKLPAG